MAGSDRNDKLQLGNEKQSNSRTNICDFEEQGLTQVVWTDIEGKSQYLTTVSNSTQQQSTRAMTNVVPMTMASPAVSLLLPKNKRKHIPITSNEIVSSKCRYLYIFGSCSQLEGPPDRNGRIQVKCKKLKPVSTGSTVTESNTSSPSIVETHASSLLTTSNLPDFPSVKHIPISSHEIVSESFSLSSASETSGASQLHLCSTPELVWTTLEKTRVTTRVQSSSHKPLLVFNFKDKASSTSCGPFTPARLSPVTRYKIISEHICPPALKTSSDGQFQMEGPFQSQNLVAPCQSLLGSTKVLEGSSTSTVKYDLPGQASTTSNLATKYIREICTENDYGIKYECSICGFESRYFSIINIHSRVHTGERPYSCNKCSYKGSQKSHLERHMKTHNLDRPYACYLCSYRTPYPNYLKFHLNEVHKV